ncbi:Fic family protein [Lentilactobacillus kisonensis]|uniref:Fido domain-containing protein n=1 Tax=Lentilactobacillus kisonensis F0435 TaxID=797516 RepID=H1LFN4_9LACO|nr:Fic family protein [Lentilactobacillus kisonensis]EHO51675.1 hypothetical protein HMPREF9104_01410 [Lentilactobacillus kisonensis F0435]
MENKTHLTQMPSRFLAKKSFVLLVYSLSKFENVKTTYAQTKTIIDGMSVAGVPVDDIQVIVNLKKGFEYVINHHGRYDFAISEMINGIVAAEDALEPGKIRTGNVQIGGVEYVPPIPDSNVVITTVSEMMSDNVSATEKALKLMYYIMRQQIFWDGNKRTAVLSANYILINAGAGIININENQLEEFNKLLSGYYESGQDTAIMQWTYDHCIYGIDFE